MIPAHVLVVIGLLLVVVSLLANFVKREALDRDNFRQTSEELVANDEIRTQLAATMVDLLYQNVDVSTELKDQLRTPTRAFRARSPASRASSQTALRAACSSALPCSSSS